MIVYMKSKEEIELFEKAGKIASNILSELIQNAKPGKSTLDLDKIAQDRCAELDVKPVFLGYHGFPAAICASVNDTLVHGIPNETPLKELDFVSIDIGVSFDGFIGDTARTVRIGKDSHPMLEACKGSLDQAILEAVPGNKLNDISKVIQKVAKDSGYSIPLGYGGHGIDKDKLHAEPFVSNIYNPYYDMTLRSGMVFAIEPMLINSTNGKTAVNGEDGWSVVASANTAHFEHTIAITDDGPIVLTEQEKV